MEQTSQLIADQIESKEFEFNTQSLAKLSQATATIIGTLLCIPDSIALIPSEPNPVSWFLHLLGLWLSAIILWFVGFLGILHFFRLVSGKAVANNQGLKLSRLNKTIPWTAIVGIGLEPQHAFSWVCGYNPPASRLVLYVEKLNFRRKLVITHKEIPSFWFSESGFQNLYQTLCQDKFGLVPDDSKVLLAESTRLPKLKSFSQARSRHRVALSIVIAIGLVLFLGRKAVVNYTYNSGNKSFKAGNYLLAKQKYESALKVDPAFAVAWSNLAGAEYHLGQIESAEKHWQFALYLKPDLVEAKVRLAHLAIGRRNFDQAQQFLSHAIKLAPANPEALINMSELNMRLGHTREAIRYARQALTVEPNNQLAICLLAQGQLQFDRPKEAINLLKRSLLVSGNHSENQFCLLVEAQAYQALGNLDKAESEYGKILAYNPRNIDALLGLSETKISQHKYDEAGTLLDRAGDNNPWVWLAKAHLALSQNDKASCRSYLSAALSSKVQDARSLASASRLALELGNSKQAISLAKQAMQMEPVNQEALSVLQTATRSKTQN